MLKNAEKIIYELLSILLMIGLIPFIENDYLLTLFYIIIIIISLKIKYVKDEWKIFLSGFILMTIFEFIFVSTGVETFNRNSLLKKMPLWLPFLWGYSFIVIRRVSTILLK